MESGGVILQGRICDQETLAPRKRYTIYKIRVNNGQRTWIVYHRYSDFVSLQGELKREFPQFILNLPPKRVIRNNYDHSFLQRRRNGLEQFIEHLFTLPKNVLDFASVRRFFHLDDLPAPDAALPVNKVDRRNFGGTQRKGFEDTKQDNEQELKDFMRNIAADQEEQDEEAETAAGLEEINVKCGGMFIGYSGASEDGVRKIKIPRNPVKKVVKSKAELAKNQNQEIQDLEFQLQAARRDNQALERELINRNRLVLRYQIILAEMELYVKAVKGTWRPEDHRDRATSI